MSKITEIKYCTSAKNKSGLVNDGLPQICFVGRSNVGKSSLINMLSNSKSIARVSSMPGRTRMVNYFLANNKFYLVDLPGYGYQAGTKEENTQWDELMDGYFISNPMLKMVFVLLDIRRDASADDKEMMRYLFDNDIPFKIVLTKADKLSNNEKYVRINRLCEQLKYNKDCLIITSSNKVVGKDDIMKVIDYCLAD